MNDNLTHPSRVLQLLKVFFGYFLSKKATTTQKLLHPNTVLFLMMLVCSCDVFAQAGYYLNPGIKIGHTFGENGGITLGLEISYTKFDGWDSYGIVASIDYCRDAARVRYHVGGEYLVIVLGPTLIVENGVVDWGVNVTPYFGVIVLPYFNYTFRFTEDNLSEVGGFLKLPILVGGKKYSLGG